MISNVQDFSSWNDHSSALKSAYMDRPLRCYGYLIDKGQGVCLRANNLHAYIELNRKIDRILPSVAPNVDLNFVHENSDVHLKSQVIFQYCFEQLLFLLIRSKLRPATNNRE